MKYKVIYPFADLHDKKYKYSAGDTFPREGLEVSEDRIKELMGSENKIRKPLIEEIPEEIEDVPEEKETGILEEIPEEEETEVPEEPKKKTTKRKK